MVNQNMLDIEVVYANPQRQELVSLQVAAGTTALEAIKQSGILTRFLEIDLDRYKIGIFSKVIPVETILREGERIEIYHPLLVDPKVARKQRAKQQAKNKNLG